MNRVDTPMTESVREMMSGFCRAGAVSMMFALVLGCKPTLAQSAPPYVWIESENTVAKNVPGEVAGWGHKEFLSGGTWLQVKYEAEQVDKALPPGGAMLSYKFEAPQTGPCQVWNRIGYEFARSPFEWRMDNGPWQTVKPDALTTDLMAIETWNEVAWLNLGDVTLTGGSHTLDIRLPKTTDDKGKTARVLYASDALCITPGPFYPNGPNKPGDDGRTDADKAAQEQVFTLPDSSGVGARTQVALAGTWEICRNDEQLPPFDIAQPMRDFPARPVWRAIAVPSDKNVSRPDLTFAHRVWYRTRVQVPVSHANRSFFLTFPRNSLNTTVYVNGVYCGFNKNPNVPFQVDVTKGVKPGQVNEVWVGIRDAWYGYSTSLSDPMKLRRKFNVPLSFVGQGFQDLAYPVWNAWQSGIVQTPVLTSAGGVYVSDVFVRPSVSKKELVADITITNGAKPAGGRVTVQAVDAKTGTIAKSWSGPPYSLAPGETKTLTFFGAWPDARLWWPEPNPQMYRLRVLLTPNQDSLADDVSETPFGFREWGASGKNFILNGQVWHGWADLNAGANKEEWLGNYRKTNQRFMRLSGYAQGGPTWQGLTPTEALNFFDENGVVVRRSGDLDGEAIGYMAIEQDPELKARYKTEIKQQLMDNWRDQMVAQVKAERNHPSIHVWSVENEWLYINCINLYGGLMDTFEAEVARCMDAVEQADPTRLSMTDGGGAGKNQLFPIHGDHYVFGDMTRYPALAYETNPTGGGRGRWVWDEKRPRYLGEDFYATGISPFDYAYFGGEETFQGKTASRRAAGIVERMLTEGYRWAGYGAYHFWLGSETAVNQYQSFAPLAVFCREWDTTFASGGRVKRTLGIFNDDFHDNGPVTLTWTLAVMDKAATRRGITPQHRAQQTATYTVPPGTNRQFTVTLPVPAISRARAEGTWILTLTQNGKERFRDVKIISVLNPNQSEAARKVLAWNRQRGGAKAIAGTIQLAGDVTKAVESVSPAVYDPHGETAGYLRSHGFSFQLVTSLAQLPKGGKVVLIGRNALTREESASSLLAAWASAGRAVIVLEQKNPLHYQALPAQMETAHNEGRTAFLEDESHPVFRGIQNRDLFTWGPGEVVYRDAYEKPTRGAKSLVQCDARLGRTALAEVPAGRGVLLVSQLVIGETLAQNPVSQQLLANLLAYAVDYKQEFRPTVLAADQNGPFARAVDATGAQFTRTTEPIKAVTTPGKRIAIVEATPVHLHTLAQNLPLLTRFYNAGGWLLLSGLTPDGLDDYSKIVGFDHMIRPFRRERVTFPAHRDPLTAGLTNGDIVLSSGQRINGYTDDVYMASDVFSHVVDFDEVAAFATLPSPSYWGYNDAGNDHNPYNIVNGFTSADSWQLIFSMWAGAGGKPQVPLTLPKAQEITELEWTGNAFYYPTKKVELTFDGKNPVPFDTRPNNETQTFPLPPGKVGKEITVRIAAWEPVKDPPIVGIDNLRLKAKRSPRFYQTVHPLLNIGAMMRYDKGAGGIVLCNLLFQDTETVPENKRKKQAILAALLRNLQSPFTGSSSVIAGAALRYTPVDLSRQANQYRDEKGWFGDKAFTFKDLPVGSQIFAGVPFSVYRFATSPVPESVMLGGPNIPGNLPEAVRGISVNRKADALFFLQTARIDRRRSDQEKKDGKSFEIARYIVTYTDGQTATVPVRSEIEIDDYKQDKTGTRVLPGAQVGWMRSYENTPFIAVAYVQQWDNPRPGVEIVSVALEYGMDKEVGVPALLAVTTASADKPINKAPK